VPVIIWINGGFGAGKTTLAEELHRRLPDAVVYDPEDVGLMLWKWMRPNGDFQHLPSWRELVVATALSLRRHHADTLIVPMSLIRDAYRAEILGGLADTGEQVLHVFLETDAGVLRERLNARARATHPDNPDWDQGARKFGLTSWGMRQDPNAQHHNRSDLQPLAMRAWPHKSHGPQCHRVPLGPAVRPVTGPDGPVTVATSYKAALGIGSIAKQASPATRVPLRDLPRGNRAHYRLPDPCRGIRDARCRAAQRVIAPLRDQLTPVLSNVRSINSRSTATRHSVTER